MQEFALSFGTIIWFLLVIIASSWYTFGGATHSNIEGKLSIQ